MSLRYLETCRTIRMIDPIGQTEIDSAVEEKQMAIQQLYNQGKTEEAEAMEKELEKMMKQLAGQQ